MKQFIAVVSVLFLMTGTLAAQEKRVEKEMTVKGEVVDVACYLMGGSKGPDHVKCAQACAKAGGSLGILTADGTVYVSLLPDDHKKSPNAILMDHIGHMVEAKGFVRAKGGVNGMMIKSVAMAKM
jgi:type 1 fimbria pilin